MLFLSSVYFHYGEIKIFWLRRNIMNTNVEKRREKSALWYVVSTVMQLDIFYTRVSSRWCALVALNMYYHYTIPLLFIYLHAVRIYSLSPLHSVWLLTTILLTPFIPFLCTFITNPCTYFIVQRMSYTFYIQQNKTLIYTCHRVDRKMTQ